jgi:magnesium chelatase family protein
LGELSLDGGITYVYGALPAAFGAQGKNKGLICPEDCGPEATIAGEMEILVAPSLLALINHLKSNQLLPPAKKFDVAARRVFPDLHDVKGQNMAKRALEVAVAVGHHLLMSGPTGAGKSMLAARLPGLLPQLSAQEALETSMINSIAGEIEGCK